MWSLDVDGLVISCKLPREYFSLWVSDTWTTNKIRRKMNFRYKRFKSAVNTKDETAWANYKKM